MAIIISSCTISKRRYMSGHSIQWKHKKPNTEIKDVVKNKYSQPAKIESNEIQVYASTEKEVLVPIKKDTKSIFNESCDIITLKNGEEIKAKVIEITQTQIKYRNCNDANSPIRSVEKAEVFMVKYVNGSKEMLGNEVKKEEKTEPTKNTETKKENSIKEEKTGNKKKNWAAIVGFILAFVAPFIGVWFCLIGMKSQLRTLATIGWILCLVYMIVFILLILMGI